MARGGHAFHMTGNKSQGTEHQVRLKCVKCERERLRRTQVKQEVADLAHKHTYRTFMAAFPAPHVYV